MTAIPPFCIKEEKGTHSDCVSLKRAFRIERQLHKKACFQCALQAQTQFFVTLSSKLL